MGIEEKLTVIKKNQMAFCNILSCPIYSSTQALKIQLK